MNFENPAWRTQPIRTATRVATSLARRLFPALAHPAVVYDGGRSRIVADLATPLGLELYRYGGRPDPDRALLGLLLESGDVCVDGGANVGLFTLVAAARVGSLGRVIAFEPATSTRCALRANLEMNGFTWVDLREEALDAHGGQRDLVVFDASGAGLSSFQPQSIEGGRRERVQTTTLDAAVRGPDRERLRLVKLDLEGAEYEALLGAGELLVQARPDLIIEVDHEHLARQNASAESLLSLLKGHGYDFYRALGSSTSGVSLVKLRAPTAKEQSPNVFATTNLARARARGVRLAE